MKDNYSVYIHVFPNNKYYVGLTKQAPKIRFGKDGTGYKNQPVIYSAIQKFGWNNIEHLIYRDNMNKEEAGSLEALLIKELDCINNGYNVSKGGGIGGNPFYIFEYNGKIYNSNELVELSPFDDMNGHTITNRINSRKWDIKSALETPIKHRVKYFSYQGKQYTISELSKISKVKHITPAIIRLRINRGWDIERTISQPLDKKNQPKGVGNRIYKYKGTMYNSYELSLLSDVDGITPFDITNRINNHGWSVEDAISIPKKRHNTTYLYNGKYYTTTELAEMSCYTDITCHVVNDRLRQGWSVDKAINTPVNKKYQHAC